MEQTMARCRTASPYRQRSIPSENKTLPKFLVKLFRQVIACMLLYIAIFLASDIEVVNSSAVWQQFVGVFNSDMDFNKVKENVVSAFAYIQSKLPEYMEAINETYGNVESEEKATEEETKSNQITPEEMKAEADKILLATTVIRPVAGVATSRFGTRVSPTTGKEELHTGVDLDCEIGTEVKSAIQGTVLEVKTSNVSLGNFVRIKNADIIMTYAHCSEILVNEGDKVSQGDVIAYSGDTGNVTGAHLHFEVTKAGNYIDPGYLLPAT